MAQKRTAQDIDLMEMIRGIPLLLSTILPPLLLFILVTSITYHLLFFIPLEWRWRAVHNEANPSLGRFYVEWNARSLLTLLVSIPGTFTAYFRLRKLFLKRRQK